MEISPSQASAATARPSTPPRQPPDRAQRQEQAQALEAEKRQQNDAPQAYVNPQGQTTGRLLNATA